MRSRLPLCLAIGLTVAAVSSMSGCGVRGPLERPPHAKEDVGDATPGTPGQKVPHKPSILDPLIR